MATWSKKLHSDFGFLISLICSNAFHFLVAGLLLCIFLLHRQIVPRVPRECWTSLCMGSLSMSVGQVIMFAKYEVIPLSSADGIQYAIYTVMATVVARLLLKENITIAKGVSLFMCMVGSALTGIGLISIVYNVQQGPKINTFHDMNITSNFTSQNFTNRNDDTENMSNSTDLGDIQVIPVTPHRNINTQDINTLLYGFLLCALNGMCDCVAFYCSTTMNDYVDHVLVVNFWYIIMSSLFSFIMMLVLEYERLTLPFQWDDIAFVTAHAITTGVGHLFWFTWIEFLSFIAIALIMNAEIPLKILCQYFLFPQLQPIKGGIFDFTGAIIITLGLTFPPISDMLQNRQDANKDKSPEQIPITQD